jgi:hypothetical protein
MKKAAAPSILVAVMLLAVAVVAEAQQAKKVSRTGILNPSSPSRVAREAAHSFTRSGKFRAPKMHRQHSFPFGIGGVGEQIIIIQQWQPAPVSESEEPATNRIYVSPRWVDGGYGVQVLKPGYWIDPEQAANR